MWVELWVGVVGTIPSNSLKGMAGTTRLELATSAVTGQRSNQLNYVPNLIIVIVSKSFTPGVLRRCDLQKKTQPAFSFAALH